MKKKSASVTRQINCIFHKIAPSLQRAPSSSLKGTGASSGVSVCVSLSHVQLLVTSWTVAFQAPLSMGILQARQSGLPCPPPGDLPDPGIEPVSPTLQACSLLSEPPGNSTETICHMKDTRPLVP